MKLKRDEPILRRIERFTVRSNQFFRERLRGQEKEKEKKKKGKIASKIGPTASIQKNEAS